MSDDFTDQPAPYWEQDAVNDRDEWDQHVRNAETEQRDHLTRDVGENPRQVSDYGVLEGWYDRPFPESDAEGNLL